jgi:Ca-activated chloride channel family protein
MLESLTTEIMPHQGSLLAPALARAARLFDDAGATDGRVLLLTDGVADRAEAVAAARELSVRGFDISVLAVGTPEGDVVRNFSGELIKDDSGQIVVARTDVAALAAVSAAGNGRFAMLTADDTDLDALLSAGEASFANGVLNEDFETDVWREEGPLIVLLCLPLVALLFRRGLIVAVAAFMLLPPPHASAGVWQDLWLTPDQQAQKRFDAEDYAGATEQFNNRQWRAAAAYRAGEYEKSAQLLGDLDDVEAHYNRGNALALAGDVEAAKEAYRSALARNPAHEDAKHNLELLDQLPEPPPQQGDSSDDQQQGEESGEQQQSDDGQSGEQDPSQSGDSQSQNSDSGETGDGEQSDDPSAAQEEQEAEGEQEQADAEEGDESEGEQREGEGRALSEEEQEQDLAAEQWLRQVPDDPGGLLRRKFERQYRLRYQGRPEEPEAW